MKKESLKWIILIDPFKKEISRIKQDVNNIDSIKKTLNCEWLEQVTLLSYPKTMVLCDEMSRVDENSNKRYVQCGQHIYVNKIMLVGVENAEITDCKLSLQDANKLTDFKHKDYIDTPIGFNWLE